MKGLEALPSMTDLLDAYNRLQSADELLPADQLALYSQWSRLDPRLAQIMVEHLARHWRQIRSGELWDELQKQPWPRAILVLLRFAELAVPKSEEKKLRHIIQALDEDLPAIPPQLFFIFLQGPNRMVVDEEVRYRTLPYRLSGFIGSQSLLGRSRWPADKTFLAPNDRRRILTRLLRDHDQVTVADYMAACKHLVSRRQAQRDLMATARASGFTRNRIYRGRCRHKKP